MGAIYFGGVRINMGIAIIIAAIILCAGLDNAAVVLGAAIRSLKK